MFLGASLVAQWRRTRLPVQETRETRVQSLSREDPLEEDMAVHSSILAGKLRGQRGLAGYSPWGHKESNVARHIYTLLLVP